MAVTINGTTGIETNTDTGKLKAGANDDIQIWHNGTDSRIDNATNKLEFRSADYVWKSSAGGHTYMEATGSEGVELYYNNTKQFETTSTGISTPGYLYLTGDGKEIRLGAGEDLRLYHSGSNSFIKHVGTGDLYLQCDNGEDIYLRPKANEDGVKVISDGAVSLYHDNVEKLRTDSSGIGCHGDCYPINNNSYDVGNSSSKWDDVYATNGTIQTSDKNEKNTIVDTDLGLSFVNKLKPVSYKFNSKTRTHYGLIAQDVETTLSDISKPTTGFAGFIKEDIPDQLYVKEDEIPEGKKVGDIKTPAYTTYGLRYNEFISPLIKAVQELSEEVNTLKTKVAALEAHTHE